MAGFVAAISLALLQIRPAAAEVTIRYGVETTMSPVYIALALGLFAPVSQKDRIRFLFPHFQSSADANKAMASGDVQLSSEGADSCLLASPRLHLALVAIDVFNQSALLVQGDSPIKTVADLKGKKVGYSGTGTPQYALLLRALRRAGLRPADVTLLKTAPAQIPILLKQKSIDAGVTQEPYVSEGLMDGDARVLLTADQIMPIMHGHFISNGVCVSKAFFASRPDVVRDITKALAQASDFINKHPDEAGQLWSKQIGVPENVIRFSLMKHISVYGKELVPSKPEIDAYLKALRNPR